MYIFIFSSSPSDIWDIHSNPRAEQCHKYSWFFHEWLNSICLWTVQSQIEYDMPVLSGQFFSVDWNISLWLWYAWHKFKTQKRTSRVEAEWPMNIQNVTYNRVDDDRCSSQVALTPSDWPAIGLPTPVENPPHCVWYWLHLSLPRSLFKPRPSPDLLFHIRTGVAKRDPNTFKLLIVL